MAQPTEITVHQQSRVLEIAFDDGARFRIPFELMRVYSPSAEVMGHGPGQEVLQAVIAGTLPATTLFEQVLGAKTLFFSFSTADEKLHAPNEFLRLRRIHEGMRAWDALLTLMAEWE